jgi:serine/threonine-protein kinase
VAEGLSALHDRGIVHRDVKPANILVCGGRPKLADFGLARAEQAGALATLTVPGTVAGTLAYLAPECLAGHPATTASDAYALGVVAFQALTGELPRAASSLAQIVETRDAVPPQVSTIAPGLGPAFDAPIAAALAPDPDARPDALGLAADLAAALGRWHRASTVPGRHGGHPATAPAVAARVPAREQPVDSAMHTVVGHRASAEGRETAPAAGRPASSSSPGARPGLVVLAAVAATIVGLAALSSVLGSPTGGPSVAPSSTPASATPAETPSPSNSPTPTPAPTPTPVPAPTADPAGPALAALDDVRAAIEDARRDGGLKRNQANELERDAGAIEDALRAGDFDLARQQTDRLAGRVEDLDDIDDDEHDALLDAVAALRTAIP